MQVLIPEFQYELEKISELSKKVNRNNSQKILEMMKDHINEITELYENNNNHFQIETADLIVLSLELLLSHNVDIDSLFTECLPRFYKKLNEKMEKKIKKKLGMFS